MAAKLTTKEKLLFWLPRLKGRSVYNIMSMVPQKAWSQHGCHQKFPIRHAEILALSMALEYIYLHDPKDLYNTHTTQNQRFPQIRYRQDLVHPRGSGRVWTGWTIYIKWRPGQESAWVSRGQIGQAKPGRVDGFMVALAQLAFLKSQSQAVKPRLFNYY